MIVSLDLNSIQTISRDIENKRPYGSTVCSNILSGHVILAKITQIEDDGKAWRSNRRRRRIKLMKFTSVSVNKYLFFKLMKFTSVSVNKYLFFTILLSSNDINLNPSPNNMKSLTKFPCKECSKNARSIIRTPFGVLYVTLGFTWNVFQWR